jgi:hypothetical protein
MKSTARLFEGKTKQLIDGTDLRMTVEIQYKAYGEEPTPIAVENQNINLVVNYMQIDADGKPYVMVPLYPHVIGYMLKAYGEGNGHLHARLNGFMGGILQMFTEKQPYRRARFSKRLPGRKLKVILPDAFRYAAVREDMVFALAKFFQNHFKERFLAFVEGAVACGSSDNGAVEMFLSKYDISPDDWCSDTARKCWRDNEK